MGTVEEEFELPDVETMRSAQEEAYDLLDEVSSREECAGVVRDAMIESFDKTEEEYVYTLRLPNGERGELNIDKPHDTSSAEAFRDFMAVVGETGSKDPTDAMFNTIPVTFTTSEDRWKADVQPAPKVRRHFISSTRRSTSKGGLRWGKGAFLLIALTYLLTFIWLEVVWPEAAVSFGLMMGTLFALPLTVPLFQMTRIKITQEVET